MSGPVEGWRPSPGGWVNWHRLVALARYRSAPVRRAVIQAREEGRLIDLTFGQATRWVAFADSAKRGVSPHAGLGRCIFPMGLAQGPVVAGGAAEGGGAIRTGARRVPGSVHDLPESIHDADRDVRRPIVDVGTGSTSGPGLPGRRR